MVCGIEKNLLSCNRDFNLHNVILDPVDNIFIDTCLIGKSMEGQMMFPGIAEDFPVPLRNAVPLPFMKSSDVFPFLSFKVL